MRLKLIHKLLFALFACAAIVLVVSTLVTRANIGRDFVDFLRQQERGRLQQLVPELVNWYAAQGSWDEMAADPSRFHQLFSTATQPEMERGGLGPRAGAGSRPGFDGRRPPPRDGRGPAGGQPPPRQGPDAGYGPRGGPPGSGNALHLRVFLVDANRHPVLGAMPPGFATSDLLPVEVDGAVVGWLGARPLEGAELPEEEAFLEASRNNLLIGLGAGLFVAALLAWLLARHLGGPVSAVAGGIRSLAAGDYRTRLEAAGSDEIARLAEDVNRLSSKLREHESARKRWMSDIAHELRTPLSVISGELEAMADGVRPLNRKQLASVQAETAHLAKLVSDLHSLALTDSGALAYRMHSLDLDEHVQLALDSVRGNAAQKNLEIRYPDAGREVRIEGDEQRVRQLLRNLLENSIRYTDAGGRVTVGLRGDARQASLTVSDTAPGVAAAECERLFERLYRAEGSRNRNSGGSGLGLAICRNIVEAHGGRITAQPGPDGGLLVTTTLPLAS